MNATLTPAAEQPAIDTAASLSNLGELILRTSRLTARGAGISDILHQAPVNGDDPQERVTVLVMLRAMFWWALRSGRAPLGITNTRRDLERTIRYIDRQLIPLAEAVRPGSAEHLALPPIGPMASDPSGAEIDVREGPATLQVIAHDQRERHDIAAVILHILGEHMPEMSVTVTLPADWQPSVEGMRRICHVIHSTHLTNSWPGCEPPR